MFMYCCCRFPRLWWHHIGFSPFNLMLAVGLYIAFVELDDHVIFVPQSFYTVDYIDGFSYVEPSLHPWDEAYLIQMDGFSDVFLDSICQYFIENFCINVHEFSGKFYTIYIASKPESVTDENSEFRMLMREVNYFKNYKSMSMTYYVSSDAIAYFFSFHELWVQVVSLTFLVHHSLPVGTRVSNTLMGLKFIISLADEKLIFQPQMKEKLLEDEGYSACCSCLFGVFHEGAFTGKIGSANYTQFGPRDHHKFATYGHLSFGGDTARVNGRKTHLQKSKNTTWVDASEGKVAITIKQKEHAIRGDEDFDGGSKKSVISFGAGPRPSPMSSLREHSSMWSGLPMSIHVLGINTDPLPEAP
ncbi:Calycin-like containing protein [Cricetulus griseus]|nr:Calycin-like containing protein [Cricetulus griseus]